MKPTNTDKNTNNANTPNSIPDHSISNANDIYPITSTNNANNINKVNKASKNKNNNKNGKNGKNNKNKAKKGIFSKLFSKKSSKSSNSLSAAAHKQITEKMLQEEQSKKSTLDILLLGAGGSGKTTVFKQMQKLFHGYVDQKEMEYAADDIRENIMKDITDLCRYNIKLRISTTDDQYIISSPELLEICSRIAGYHDMSLQNDIKLDIQLASDISLLWNDLAIKNTWDNLRKSHVMDNTPYFFNKITEIASVDYIVTFDDYVRVRNQTTGIIHKKFVVDTMYGKYKFNVTDVGGQRSERRKWLKLFDNISVVVYIMNLAGYDQVLYEDNSKNCLNETFELFSSTSSVSAFDKTDWVVFFNKIDIFTKKIQKVPFTVFKSDFDINKANDSDTVQKWIRDEFNKRFINNNNSSNIKKKGNIYFHTTCATDAKQVGSIIKKVQIDIVSSAMKKMGYLM